MEKNVQEKHEAINARYWKKRGELVNRLEEVSDISWKREAIARKLANLEAWKVMEISMIEE